MTEQEARRMKGKICVRSAGVIEIPCKILKVEGRTAIAHFPIGGEQRVDVAFLHEADAQQEAMYLKHVKDGG